MSFVCVVMWHFGGSLCVTEERHRHFWIQDWLHFVLFFVFFPDYVSSPLCTHVLWYSHLISMWWTCIHISFYKTRQICLTRVFYSWCVLLLCFDRQAYDGENTSSRLLGNFTRDGMMGHIINSTSNRLWLEFNSNASGTSQGFRLTYTSELFENFLTD